MPVRRALVATALAAGLSIAGMQASAATLTNSFAGWQAGVAGAAVDTTVSTGLANPLALPLPTTSVVPLADGLTVGLSALAQVTQPQNVFPYLLPGGSTPDLLIPVDASGNQLQSETLTLGTGSISALGFDVVPFSSSLDGPYTITVQLAGGQASTASTSTVSLPGADFNTGTTTPGFFGFYGGGVSSLTITTSDPNGFAFGDFVDVPAVGVPTVGVPEPASLALLLTGVIGMAGQARRRA